MHDLKRLATVTLVFALLSGMGLLLSHLALTDIWHGDEDLSAEWGILRATGVILVIFLGLTLSLSLSIRRSSRV